MAALANERHERFCHEILGDPEGKAGRAYERSGYRAKGDAADAAASRLLKDDRVAARLQELKDARSERTGVSLDYVVDGLVEIAERCMARVEPVFVGRGQDREQATDEDGRKVYQFDASGATRAFELLGKHVGAFEADNKQKAPGVVRWELHGAGGDD